MTEENEERGSWAEYFISMAQIVASRSKDPSTKVGCVIVNPDTNKTVSTGYNGFPAKCDESFMTFERPMKYHLTIHAEMNALAFAHTDLTNHMAFVTHAPCENCLKHMIAFGIRRIYYKDGGPLVQRGSTEQKDAISRLISSTKTLVMNMNGALYTTELDAIPEEPSMEKLRELFFRNNKFQIAAEELLIHFKTVNKTKFEEKDMKELEGYAQDGALSMMASWFEDRNLKAFSARALQVKEKVSSTFDAKILGV
jgi:dCMP deaminase